MQFSLQLVSKRSQTVGESKLHKTCYTFHALAETCNCSRKLKLSLLKVEASQTLSNCFNPQKVTRQIALKPCLHAAI